MVVEIHPFRCGSPKEAALKPLEEAAEVFGAWQALQNDLLDYADQTGLADEIADCMQACANLAARYGLDMDAAMRRCEERNRRRGRYDGDGE